MFYDYSKLFLLYTLYRFIRILENFVENGGKFSQNTSNIKIRVLQNLDERTTSVKQTFNNDSTILIPKEVLNKAKNKTMYFIYYKNGNLFKRKRLIKQICMDNGFTENVYEQSTAVMSSGISGETVSNLSEKVIIKFHVADPKVITSVLYMCLCFPGDWKLLVTKVRFYTYDFRSAYVILRDILCVEEKDTDHSQTDPHFTAARPFKIYTVYMLSYVKPTWIESLF